MAKRKDLLTLALLGTIAVILVGGCGTTTKLRKIRSQEVSAELRLPGDEQLTQMDTIVHRNVKDTIVMEDKSGQKLVFWKATVDNEGVFHATEQLDAAVVTARFRNVAERHGKCDIAFQITVPPTMLDSKWQLRFYPKMDVLDEHLDLQPVFVTGKDYRKVQLKGYQQYQRFLNTIITDSTKFLNVKQLEYFLMRNLPQIYAFRNNQDIVSDEEFNSFYGVTEKEAIDHYTYKMMIRHNERRKSMKEKMFHRYVKSPILHEGLRLDTLYVDENGSFVYDYVQTVNARPKLRKVDVTLTGDIFEQAEKLYSLPPTKPLEFFISSVSTLVDNTERYKTAVIERKVAANTTCFIDFEQGKSEVKPRLFNNEEEINRIHAMLVSLLENEKFDLDSILVTASASPEGSITINNSLCQKRAESVSQYFQGHIRQIRDSLRTYGGFSVDEFGKTVKANYMSNIKFNSKNGGENWDRFVQLMDQDENITSGQKHYFEKCMELNNLDAREDAIKADKDLYKYCKDKVYPRLRTVRFDFQLHRRGMVKDTVHTTVIDTTYMDGVQAIRDRDYDRAVVLLRPYNDYNYAVACVAKDYNTSAISVLENMEQIPPVKYMLALVYSREGRIEEAVKLYVECCKEDRSYIHRGNLDPEINALIKAYNLNKQEDEDLSLGM